MNRHGMDASIKIMSNEKALTIENSSELVGFVAYYPDFPLKTPVGVVSQGYDCHALSYSIPESIKKFLIEVEDQRFLAHKGIDIKGIIRALASNIRALKIVQGGSTISQQLARNLMRNNAKTISRKIKESILAVSLESQFSKDEILNLYWDNIYFGKNLWGIRAASLSFFNKEVEQLNQHELLYLMVILRGPNFYLNNKLATQKRYLAVNDLLYDKKIISLSSYRKNSKKHRTIKVKNTQLINFNGSSHLRV